MTSISPIRTWWLSILLFWVLSASGCGGSNEAPSTAQQQAPRTQALVILSDSDVMVKNLGATIPDAILLINVKRPEEKVVQAVVGDIPSGKTVNIFYADFT